MSTAGAAGSAAGQCANTAGRPPVPHTSATGNPVSRRYPASHSADRRTSPCRDGSAETDGMASHSRSAAKNPGAWRSMYSRTSMLAACLLAPVTSRTLTVPAGWLRGPGPASVSHRDVLDQRPEPVVVEKVGGADGDVLANVVERGPDLAHVHPG